MYILYVVLQKYLKKKYYKENKFKKYVNFRVFC